MAKQIRGIKMGKALSSTLGWGWLCEYWPKQTVLLNGEPVERIHMFYVFYTKKEAKSKFKEYLMEVIPNYLNNL
jgi:hypothetical protein